MAVASEGFSIREYASKMRSENVGRSWPFGGDVEKKQIESILPPITVTKFRWWLHELESARSCRDCASDGAIQAKEDNKGAEMLEAPPLGCAVCGGLGAPSISATLTSHNGNCLVNEEMKHRAKTKSKAPKKRSIMEIFAVAAQIESATNKLSSNRVGEASSSRSSNPISSKSKKNKTKKNKNNKKKKNLVDKTRLLPVDNRKFKNKKKKKKKMGRNHHHQHQDALITLENAYKLKQKIASNWTRNLDGSSDGMYTGRIFGNSVCRKKRQLKSSSLTKHEAGMASKFCKRQDKLHVPVRGILKKRGKLHLNSDSRNIVHLEKHVKFLDNVEVQVSPQNSLTSIQQSDRHARFSGADKLIGNDEEFSLVEVTSGDDEDTVPIESGNRAQVTLEKEHITETRNQGNAETENYSSPQHASPHHCRNSSLTESISTRQVPKCCKDVHTSIKGKSVMIDDSTTTENSRFLTQIRGTQGTNTNIQMPESPLACNIVGPSHGVCGMSTIQSPRTSSQLTPSRLFLNESLNRSFYLQSPPAIEDTSARPVIYQQLRRQRPMNLFNGAFTCPDQWNPRPCSLTEECTYKDLWGLPLNSRGELIQMNSASNSNFVLNQLHSSGMVSGSSPGQSFTQPICAENDLGLNASNFGQRSRPRHLDLFPMHNCDSHGPSADVFWQNPKRHVSPSCSINTDLNLVNVSFDMCGHHGYDSVQHQRELNQGIPPMAKENRVSSNSTPLTMRLMGKDVAVARSNTREPEDENIWTDKEIIIEHLQPEEDPFTQSTFQKSQGSANLLFEHQKNMQCKSLAKPHHSLLLNPYVNWHPDSVPQRDRFHFTGSSDHEWQPVSQASFNFTSLREPLVSEPRLALPSLPRGSSQCIHWVPKQNYHPNPPCPRASGFDFPFVHHDSGEYVQHASLFENPFKDVPPWLHPSDQGRSMPTANSLVFPDGIQRSYLSQTPPNMFNSSVTFTTYSPVDPPSHWRSPFGPSPAVRPRLLEVDPPSHWRSPFVPSPAVRPRLLEAVPGIEPVSTSKVNYGSRIESNDRIMSPAFGVMTPELSARTRKRPAVKSVDPPMKLGRMPNLGLLKHRSIDRSPTKETFFHEVECSGGGGGGGGGGAIRLDSSSGKSSAERLPDGNRAQNNGQRYFTGTKKFSTTRPAPAKLSAGGRHVLKSTQATDQDNSRLIHSMVPPSEVPDCIMVPESQARSTKTYKI